MKCPFCHSDNTSPAEQEFSRDYPLWVVFAALTVLILVLLLFFLFLQLHPVIIILILIAVASRLLDKSRKLKNKRIEYICLNCQKRFVEEISSDKKQD